jgi:hypothetical protein
MLIRRCIGNVLAEAGFYPLGSQQSFYVKATSLLTIVALVLAGCGEQAPATNRLPHDPPIDLHHLHEVFIPSYDVGSRAKLVRSVEHLEACLAEFEAFMQGVAEGKIAVTQEYFSGHWLSSIEKPDAWITATYADKLGPVIGFQKHHKTNRPSMIYHFNFNATGYIVRADMPLEGFDFDDEGRLRRWHGENVR